MAAPPDDALRMFRLEAEVIDPDGRWVRVWVRNEQTGAVVCSCTVELTKPSEDQREQEGAAV